MGAQQDAVDQLTAIAQALRGPGIIKIPLNACSRADTGAPLAVFADGASAVPGIQITDSESFTIRWNNHATPTEVSFNDVLPRDLDPDYPMVFNAIVSKTGATSGDATSIQTSFCAVAVGSLHDADTPVTGSTNAVTGAATAKTTALLQRTIPASDLPATPYPGFFSFLFGPTDGTLGTDDFLVHAAWFTYTKRSVQG